MNNHMSSYDNPEWQGRPQASYPQPQSGSYYPQQQTPGYPNPPAMPQQPYPNQNPYPPQQPGSYQTPPPAFNVNINNVQNGFMQEPYDPYRSAAITARTMGIIAVTAWLIPFVGSLASLVCAIIGFIISFKGLKSVTHHGSAVAGMILSIIALVIMVGATVIFGSLFFAAMMSHSSQP